MLCPYCGREMIRGAIRVNFQQNLFGDIYWLPEGAQPLLRTAGQIQKHGGIMLAQGISPTLEAWSCRACGKLILSCADGGEAGGEN